MTTQNQVIEVSIAVNIVKKFSLYCSNVSTKDFLSLLYPNSHPSYTKEKLAMFRKDPCGYYMSLEQNKKELLMSAVLKSQ